jgi:general stress protein 26
MPDVEQFEDIAAEFDRRVRQTVWATVTTVDRKGRPRSRILHPYWEGSTGWILTGRETLKTKHLAANPYVSVSYWDQRHEQIYADCKAEWVDDLAAKQRIWDAFKAAPAPYGYDPGMIWTTGAGDPTLGLLKLVPWRIEIYGLNDLGRGAPKVWRPSGGA